MRSRRLRARATAGRTHPAGDRSPSPASWNVVAASVRGSAHARTGAPCQDAHAFLTLADGTLIAAVADGLGSVALAEVGARRAVDAAVATMRAAICSRRRARRAARSTTAHAVMVRQAFAVARAALEVEARARDVPLSALAATLLVVVVTPRGAATVGQLGDGVVIALTPEGTFHRPIAPTDTAAFNVVTPLTHPDALRSVRIATLGCVDAVAMCTDGLELFVTDGPAGAPYAPFLSPALRFAAASEHMVHASDELAEWLSSPRITAGTDDDCTLLLAVRADARARLARPTAP